MLLSTIGEDRRSCRAPRRPEPDAELQAYREETRSVFETAWDVAKDNLEYVAAGAMVVGGAALMFTPLGPTAGVGLISAGFSAGAQKFTRGEVSWGQVAAAGALGAVGGGAASWAAKASVNGTKALVTSVGLNATVGSASSTGMYLVNNQRESTLWGAVGAGVGGAVAGAVGGASGAAAGTLAMRATGSSVGPRATALTMGFNFAGGFGGRASTDLVQGRDVDLLRASLAGGLSSVGGFASTRLSQNAGLTTKGTYTLKQQSYIGTRSIAGLRNLDQHNTRAMYGSLGIGAGVGSGLDSGSFALDMP